MINTRIFISGGAGVIGREMVKYCIKEGYSVMVGDLLPMPNEFSKEVLYRQGDLNFITQQELDKFNPEVFVHLAATFERSDETYEHWEQNFLHNVKLSNHLMTLMRNVPALKRVVYASSYLVYDKNLYNFIEPQPNPVKLKEDSIKEPRNLTGMAKLSHEIELEFLSKFNSDKFKSISARIFRGYGKGSKDVISRWIRDALNGDDINVYNREGVFDYIYAKDTAEGLIRLSQIDESGIVNLGTGRSRSVEDVISILSKNFPKLKIKYTHSDSLYESSEANVNKLESLINWLPKYDLEQTIEKIIDYEKYNQPVVKYSNVLITSISKKVPLINAVTKATKKINDSIKVYGGDSNESCIGKHFVYGFWHMPTIENLNFEDLIKFCEEKNIKFIIPTRDGELKYFSSIKYELLKFGIFVKVSDEESITLCLDKLKFSNLEGGNCIPSFEKVEDITENRVVVKERYGSGSDSIGIDLDKKNASIHSKKLKNPIFQPHINGQEISVDAYISVEGDVKGIIMRNRDLIINGESQVTSTFIDDSLEQEFRRILTSLNLFGHVILQAIKSDDNKIYIIECNPRFGGASTLSIEAGLDSFYWSYLESMKIPLKDYQFFRIQRNLTLVRYPKDIFL